MFSALTTLAANSPPRQHDMSAPTRTPRRASRAAGSRALAPIVIERVRPEVDAGRFPAKRVVGDVCLVSADIFKDGHDQLAARVRYRSPGEGEWSYARNVVRPERGPVVGCVRARSHR